MTARDPADLRRQRGGAMLIAMISLVGLLGAAGVTVLTMTGGMSAAANDRFRTVALYAAESGAAAASVYLREQYATGTYWTALVSPSNEAPQSPEALPGNRVPSADHPLLGTDLDSWYEVTILNNPSDPTFAEGVDSDRRLLVRSVGHGPNGALAIIELEVASSGAAQAVGRCEAYVQDGINESNDGRNDCVSEVDGAISGTFRPGT